MLMNPSTNTASSTETLLIHLPDVQVDLNLNSPAFLISNAGNAEQATLDFFTDTLMPTWLEKQFSLHQLAQFLSGKAELWTAPTVELVSRGHQEPFAFWIKFLDAAQTTFLVQCELTARDKVH